MLAPTRLALLKRHLEYAQEEAQTASVYSCFWGITISLHKCNRPACIIQE